MEILLVFFKMNKFNVNGKILANQNPAQFGLLNNPVTPDRSFSNGFWYQVINPLSVVYGPKDLNQ